MTRRQPTKTRPDTEAEAQAEAARRAEAQARAVARWKADVRRSEFCLRTFMRLYSPHLEHETPLGEIADVCDLAMRKPVLVLAEGPARHTKTTLFLHHLARRIKFRPNELNTYTTYANALAQRKSRLCREICARAGVWVGGVKKRRDEFDASRSVSFWQTTEGGGLVAGGRRGQYTGEGYGTMLLDDLIKNREEAESPEVCNSIFEDTFQGTLFNRLDPEGSMFVTHQPWNDADPIARISEWAEKEGIEIIRITIPAIRNPEYDTKRDRIIGGEAIWPEHWPIDKLIRIARIMGPYNFESQYQCNRTARGSRPFKVDPVQYETPREDNVRLAISCDPGLEEDRKADESAVIEAVVYWVMDDSGVTLPAIDILNVEERNEETPEMLDNLEYLQTRVHPGAVCLLETVAAFKILTQVAPRLNRALDITRVSPTGSKFLRALPVADAVADGRIRIRKGAPWAGLLCRRLKAFTGREGGKDGLVDALSQLYDYAERVMQGGTGKALTGESREMSDSPF